MKKLELEIVALSHSITQSHSYAVVLGEVGGMRKLPIVIGGFEAQAIAVAIEKIAPSRPLTHDLMKNCMDTFGASLSEVVINKLQEGVFYSVLVCELNGEKFEIDSRTSDALALAVRYSCPIFTFEPIMEAAGIIIEESDLKKEREIEVTEEPAESNPAKKEAEEVPIQKRSLNELKKLLKDAVEKEDYVAAAKIRDEINLRSKN